MVQYTGNNVERIYGEMYQVDNASQTTINTVNVWEQIVNFLEGQMKRVSFSSSSFTAPSDGDYQMFYSVSSAAVAANKNYEIAISVNDTIKDHSKTQRRYSSTDVGVVAGTAIETLSAGDIVKLEVRNITDATNITIVNANVQIHKA